MCMLPLISPPKLLLFGTFFPKLLYPPLPLQYLYVTFSILLSVRVLSTPIQTTYNTFTKNPVKVTKTLKPRIKVNNTMGKSFKVLGYSPHPTQAFSMLVEAKEYAMHVAAAKMRVGLAPIAKIETLTNGKVTHTRTFKL